MSDDLANRVLQFSMLELPGQPMMMHMGTSYLVNDLWSEVKASRATIADLVKALDEARAQFAFWHNTAKASAGKPLMPHITPSGAAIEAIDAALLKARGEQP